MRKFTEFTDDERTEWRNSPVTQAFIAWMKAEADAAGRSALEAIRAGTLSEVSPHLATMYAGKQGAYEHAIDTATRSFNE